MDRKFVSWIGAFSLLCGVGTQMGAAAEPFDPATMLKISSLLSSSACSTGKCEDGEFRITSEEIAEGGRRAFLVERKDWCPTVGCMTGLIVRDAAGSLRKLAEGTGMQILTGRTSEYREISIGGWVWKWDNGEYTEAGRTANGLLLKTGDGRIVPSNTAPSAQSSRAGMTIPQVSGSRSEPVQAGASPKASAEAEFDAEQARRLKLSPTSLTMNPGGERAYDIGIHADTGSPIWAWSMSSALALACDIQSQGQRLRAFTSIASNQIASINDQDLARLIGAAAARIREWCPQVRLCQVTRTVTLSNPLGPKVPDKEQVVCSYDKSAIFQILVVATRTPGRIGGDTIASATVDQSGRIISLDDSVRRQMREAAMLEKAKVDSKARFDEFAARQHISAWPKASAVEANPFAFEGKVIGLYLEFQTMMSAGRGIFRVDEAGGGGVGIFMVVSGVPTMEFTIKHEVILAGRVLGKEQIKVPILGDVLVPHLKFVAEHHCQELDCDDFLRWRYR
jgi:hypothetical protein